MSNTVYPAETDCFLYGIIIIYTFSFTGFMINDEPDRILGLMIFFQPIPPFFSGSGIESLSAFVQFHFQKSFSPQYASNAEYCTVCLFLNSCKDFLFRSFFRVTNFYCLLTVHRHDSQSLAQKLFFSLNPVLNQRQRKTSFHFFRSFGSMLVSIRSHFSFSASFVRRPIRKHRTRKK